MLASITIAVDVQPAAAEIYRPWCVQYGGNDGDNGTTCAFTTFEQCMMTARGIGSCVQNPWYLAYGSGQKRAESAGRSGRAKRALAVLSSRAFPMVAPQRTLAAAKRRMSHEED